MIKIIEDYTNRINTIEEKLQKEIESHNVYIKTDVKYEDKIVLNELQKAMETKFRKKTLEKMKLEENVLFNKDKITHSYLPPILGSSDDDDDVNIILINEVGLNLNYAKELDTLNKLDELMTKKESDELGETIKQKELDTLNKLDELIKQKKLDVLDELKHINNILIINDNKRGKINIHKFLSVSDDQYKITNIEISNSINLNFDNVITNEDMETLKERYTYNVIDISKDEFDNMVQLASRDYVKKELLQAGFYLERKTDSEPKVIIESEIRDKIDELTLEYIKQTYKSEFEELIGNSDKLDFVISNIYKNSKDYSLINYYIEGKYKLKNKTEGQNQKLLKSILLDPNIGGKYLNILKNINTWKSFPEDILKINLVKNNSGIKEVSEIINDFHSKPFIDNVKQYFNIYLDNMAFIEKEKKKEEFVSIDYKIDKGRLNTFKDKIISRIKQNKKGNDNWELLRMFSYNQFPEGEERIKRYLNTFFPYTNNVKYEVINPNTNKSELLYVDFKTETIKTASYKENGKIDSVKNISVEDAMTLLSSKYKIDFDDNLLFNTDVFIINEIIRISNDHLEVLKLMENKNNKPILLALYKITKDTVLINERYLIDNYKKVLDIFKNIHQRTIIEQQKKDINNIYKLFPKQQVEQEFDDVFDCFDI